MKIKITSILLFFSVFLITAQTAEERSKIIQSNNQNELQNLIVQFEAQHTKDQERLIAYAKENNIPIFKKNKDGSFDQLMRVSDAGVPIYYSIDNVDAAISTRANRLHSGNSLGLNIEGQGMTAYVWDGGPSRTTHQEFGSFSGVRASVGDGQTSLNNNSFHATHVSGTIASSGVNPAAKGMAPQAQVITNDWTNDEAEMAAAGANGALISNHSYGIRVSQFSSNNASQFIGKYTQSAKNIDQITFNAPYYLPVYSAGNDGNDSSNSLPINSNSSFDKLTGDKVAKNTMVVANARDASINPDGSLNSVVINFGSSQGPSDDFRVKPDISGNGTQLLSSFDSSDVDYGTISGTSMAAPNVAGSMLLLQQYYNERNGNFMRAATLKGLTLHTADDFGLPGPDIITGWGLMNTMAAAKAITEDKLNSKIIEASIDNGQSYSITVESDNMDDLQASISWTDPAGNVNTGGANDTTPALVNDLDIRITQNGTVFEPWKLTGLASNIKGDNIVDNFERVDVANASGTYTITVTHKGNLVNGSQAFSLIVTGEFNEYAINSSTQSLEVCNDQSAIFPLEFLADPSFSDTASLTVSGLPSGVTSNFSSGSFSGPGTGTLSLTNLSAAPDGIYTLVVTAATATESKTLNLSLRILSDNLAPTNLRFPANLATSVSTAETLDWDDELNAQRYQIQIAPNSSFGRPLVDEIVDISSYVLNPASFISSSNYFWRVKALNDCGEGAYTTNSFTTFACNELNSAVPTPISIPDNDTNGIQSSFTVNEANNIAIGKLTVEVASTHEYSGDLLISLTSPSGTTVTLTNPNGCDTPNFNVLFDDDSQPFVCNTQAGLPGYTGVVAPVGNLSDFNGENINGVWTLNVSDRGPADLGTLNNWKITYCESPATASNADVETSEFVVYPNPSKGLFTVAAGSNNVNTSDAVINVLDLNGRVVFTKEVQNASRLNETIDVQNLSKGLYLLRVQQGASSTVKKIIIK